VAEKLTGALRKKVLKRELFKPASFGKLDSIRNKVCIV